MLDPNLELDLQAEVLCQTSRVGCASRCLCSMGLHGCHACDDLLCYTVGLSQCSLNLLGQLPVRSAGECQKATAAGLHLLSALRVLLEYNGLQDSTVTASEDNLTLLTHPFWSCIDELGSNSEVFEMTLSAAYK